MTDPKLITHDCAAEAFLDAFRRRVGAGAGKVRLADFADAIDMDPRTVKAWHGGETMPNYPNLLKVCAALGPSFASEILHPAGLGGVDQIAPVDVDAQGTATELVKVAHDLLDRLADGVFCHVDKAKAAPLLLDLSRMIDRHAGQGLNSLPRGCPPEPRQPAPGPVPGVRRFFLSGLNR